MLKRKIYGRIEEFYRDKPHGALMITGAKGVGKTYIIEKYAASHYKHFIHLDFSKHPEYTELLQEIRGAEDTILKLSAVFGKEMIPEETMIFFDEVQECKELITQIKYLVQDGRYAYALSSSLPGSVFQDVRSVPVGYMGILRMYPLDFEEFARANGVGDIVFPVLKEAFVNKLTVDTFIHRRLLSLFDRFLIVGGMPAAVEAYLKTKNLYNVMMEQTSIIAEYKQDIPKYGKKKQLSPDKILDLLPDQLNAKNKRFILNKLDKNAKFAKYSGSFRYLRNAGIVIPAYRVTEPEAPLLLSKASDGMFKLFFHDVGLLSSQHGSELQRNILCHKTSIYFGSIYENAAAQELEAHGHTLYFYRSKKFGELDFVIEKDGVILPIVIQSGKDYSRHSAMDHVLNQHDIPEGYVFRCENVVVRGKVVCYPIYMLMFL